MAMAHKAPMDHYERTHYISLHAVEQLRMRIGKKHELFHRDNNDVSNAIDEAVNIGLKRDDVEKFEYEGKPNIGVNISDFFNCPLKAIIAKNEKKNSKQRGAVVTILSGNMVMKKDKSAASIGDAISPELRAALQASVGGKQEEINSVIGPDLPPGPAQVRSVVEMKPSKISTCDVSPDRRLITYIAHPGETKLTIEEFVAPGDLRNRLFDLHQKGRNLDEITVWKPSRASIAIAVDFEEG